MLNFTKTQLTDAILSYGESIGKRDCYEALLQEMGHYRMTDIVAVDVFTHCSDMTTSGMDMIREYVIQIRNMGAATFKNENV